MSLTGARVLVTGAGGFIGSHLAERLVELGANTVAFVHYHSTGDAGWLDGSPLRREMEVIAGDVRDAGYVREMMRGVDVVFHLAALIGIPYSYDAPRSYVDTNVGGTLNVLEGVRDAECGRIVHTSTSEVYGSARYVPIDEDHPVCGQSPYSASKIAADHLAESFSRSFSLPVVTLRPFNTYGPRQSARAVIPTIVSQCLAGSEIRLGSLRPTRDFSFVSDTVEAFVRAADAEGAVGQVINVGNGKEIGIGDLARRIAGLLNREARVVLEEERGRPEASEVQRLCAGTERAREVLGWGPEVGLDEGLSRVIKWMESHGSKYRPETYAI